MMPARARTLLPLLGALLALLLLPAGVAAQNSIRARVEPERIAKGDTFDYIIEFEGAATRVQRPDPKTLVGPISYRSFFSNNRVTQGGRTVISYVFKIEALDVGEFRIPPAIAYYGTTELRSNEVRGEILEPLEVKADPRAMPSPAIVGYANPDSLNRQLEGNFFAELVAPEEMTVFQPAILETYIYRKENSFTWVRGPMAANPRDLESLGGGDAFLVVRDATSEVSSSTWERVNIDGEAWRRALAFRTTVIPTRAGEFEVNGAALSVQFQLDRTLRSVQANFPQPSRTVSVRGIPAKPPGAIEQVVGNVTVSATIDKPSVREGDLVTLRVRLSGAAYLELADLRALPAIPGLDLVSQEVGFQIDQSFPRLVSTKNFDLIFQATRPGKLEVPALSFAVFDPDSRKQSTTSTRPISIEVEARGTGAISLGGGASSPTAPRGEARSLGGEGILYIDTSPLTAASIKAAQARPIGGRWWYWALHLAALGAVAAYFIVLERARAEGRDPARRHVATGRARAAESLRAAASSAAASQPDAFYAALASGVRHAIAAVTGREASGLTAEEAAAGLQDRGIDEAVARKAATLLERCDSIRYAPVPPGDARRQDLDEARAIIDAAERALA